MNKKRIILFFCLLLIASFFVNSYSVLNNISLENNQTIRVFVSLNSNLEDNSKFMKSSYLKSDSFNELKEDLNVVHDFGDYFSLELNQSQLEELENSSIFQISTVPERKLFLTQSVPLINASPVFNTQINGVNITGKGESVCIVDTGVDFNHPDLRGKNLTCVLDCVYGACLPNCSLGDYSGHGTHIAGIIGANGNLKGVAPEVNLIGIKACVGSSCFDDHIIAGINWCVNNSKNYNISVISLSLGGEILYSSPCDSMPGQTNIALAINSAIKNNVSVVIATGNDDSSIGISSPSCIKNATRVSSVTKSFLVSSFSNRVSSFLDILFAPGTEIYSTYPNGNYQTMSGTSMSTPHVSGAIALLNQYKKLEGENKLTPQEISTILVQSGKPLYDSRTSSNYSILDIYSAILQSDSSSPNITLISPKSNLDLCYGEVLFKFEVRDLQLANVSLSIWDSENILIDSVNISFNSNQFSFNYTTNLSYGTYYWGVYASDKNNNFKFSNNSSFSISTSSVCSNLLFPENNFYSNSSSLEFICESFSSNTTQLSNVSIYIWDSSKNLIFYNVTNISGNYNVSYFNFGSFNEGEEYSWACVSYDNFSNFSFGSSNYSIYFDLTLPAISLVSPANSFSYSGSQTIDFVYSLEEENPDSCSLILNNQKVLTRNIISSGENSFSYNVPVGSYEWNIECIDLASNIAYSSENRVFSISSISSGGSSGGGGSTKKTSVENYSFSNSVISSGTTNSFSIGQSAKFSINGQEHKFLVKEIYAKYIVTEIFSDPLIVYLMLNSMQKVNLDNDNYYDLEIKYAGLENNQASIFIKQIHEKIEVRNLLNESVINSSKENVSVDNSTYHFEPVSNYLTYKRVVTFLLWIIIILVFFIFVVRLIKFLIIYSDPENRDILKYKVPEYSNKANESI